MRIESSHSRRVFLLLTIPLVPALSRNSTTPIELFVICDAIVPKLIAGARHAKYRNRIAGTTFLMFFNPSVQSEAYTFFRRAISRLQLMNDFASVVETKNDYATAVLTYTINLERDGMGLIHP